MLSLLGRRDTLYAAAGRGDVEGVQRLLADGAAVDEGLVDGRSPLYAAASSGHAAVASALLDAGADVNLCAENGDGPLFVAACTNQPAMVRLLLARGADVTVMTTNGIRRTALTAASRHGFLEIVVDLLQHGAPVEDPPELAENASPLGAAAHGGHTDVMEALLAAGADPNRQEGTDQLTPVHLWALGHCVGARALQLLVDKGGDVERRAGDGATPLLIASTNNRPDGVKALLALPQKPDANVVVNEFVTPLLLAAFKHHNHVVVELLKGGADIEHARQLAAKAPPSNLFVHGLEVLDAVLVWQEKRRCERVWLVLALQERLPEGPLREAGKYL